jgi:hypothetical protein
MSKQCFKCGETKPLHDFYKHPQMGDGHLNKCKVCTRCDVTEHTRKKWGDADWRMKERERGREKYWRLYRGKKRAPGNKRKPGDPVKIRARAILYQALKAGSVLRPEHCEDCNETAKVHAHHEDYSKPLDVDWLCTICHGKRHRKAA